MGSRDRWGNSQVFRTKTGSSGDSGKHPRTGPDEVFERAERLARRVRQSRSEVFSRALREYVARHAPKEVTEAMDRVCAEVGDRRDPFTTIAARQTLERSEW